MFLLLELAIIKLPQSFFQWVRGHCPNEASPDGIHHLDRPPATDTPLGTDFEFGHLNRVVVYALFKLGGRDAMPGDMLAIRPIPLEPVPRAGRVLHCSYITAGLRFRTNFWTYLRSTEWNAMGMRHSGPKGTLTRGKRGSVAPEGAGFTSARSHGLRRGLTSVALRAWQRREGVAETRIFDEKMCKLP